MSVRLRPNPPVAPLAQWQSADLLSPEIAVQVRGGVRACTPTGRGIALRRHSVGVRIAAGTPRYDFARSRCRFGAQSPHQAADSRMWNLLLVASAQRKSIFALGSVCPSRA